MTVYIQFVKPIASSLFAKLSLADISEITSIRFGKYDTIHGFYCYADDAPVLSRCLMEASVDHTRINLAKGIGRGD